MTRQSILSIILVIVLILFGAGTAFAGNPGTGMGDGNNKEIIQGKNGSAPGVQANYPGPGLKANGHKLHLQKIDELGKLHRFHNERVKKARKRAALHWLLARLLLAVIHLSLLIHAFMHLGH